MATGPAPNDAIARLHAIDAALSDSERRHVVYDFGEVRGLDYYTGIHFEIFVAGAGTAVGAGGRCDDLMGRLGRPLPAVALGFGRCRMVVASPTQIPYPALPGGVTPRVATKYPRLTRAFFAETGQGVEVITVSGSVEVAPLLGLSHWIVDLVDTGRTLRENGLVERAAILDVGAVLVV